MVPQHDLAAQVVMVGNNNFGAMVVQALCTIIRIGMRFGKGRVVSIAGFDTPPEFIYFDVKGQEVGILRRQGVCHTCALCRAIRHNIWYHVEMVGGVGVGVPAGVRRHRRALRGRG